MRNQNNFFPLILLAVAVIPTSFALATESKVTLEHCGLIASAPARETISAAFSQERIISGLRKPLISHGNFQLTAGKEIVWETLKPIHSKVIVSANGIELNSSLDDVIKKETHSDAKFRELGAILLSIHSLTIDDTKNLALKFTLDCYANTDGTFTIRAKPKSRSLKRVLNMVQIQGVDKPLKIIISDSRGDTTTIKFSYTEKKSTTVTDSEK